MSEIPQNPEGQVSQSESENAQLAQELEAGKVHAHMDRVIDNAARGQVNRIGMVSGDVVHEALEAAKHVPEEHKAAAEIRGMKQILAHPNLDPALRPRLEKEIADRESQN